MTNTFVLRIVIYMKAKYKISRKYIFSLQIEMFLTFQEFLRAWCNGKISLRGFLGENGKVYPYFSYVITLLNTNFV